jgi:hypothetical protein
VMFAVDSIRAQAFRLPSANPPRPPKAVPSFFYSWVHPFLFYTVLRDSILGNKHEMLYECYGSITNRLLYLKDSAFFLYLSHVSLYSYLCIRSEYLLVDASILSACHFQCCLRFVAWFQRKLLRCSRNHYFARNYKAIFVESVFETIGLHLFEWYGEYPYPILLNITSLWMKLAQTLMRSTFYWAKRQSSSSSHHPIMRACACM